LCVICSPYYRQPWHPTTEYINTVTDKLFEIADYQIFEFTGGEPLMRKDFPKILDYTLKYKNSVHNYFGFQTNGAIPVSDDLVYSVKKYGSSIRIIVDNYGTNLSVHSKSNYETLKTAGVQVEIRNQYDGNTFFNGWVDYLGDGNIDNSPEKAKEIFNKCAQPIKFGFCATTIGGIVMPCPIMQPLALLYYAHPPEYEFVDLFDKTETLEQKRIKWEAFYKLNILSACRYCNGMCEDSKRFIPAIQFSREEITAIQNKLERRNSL